MVKSKIIVFLALLFFPTASFAAGFAASVDHDQVAFGKSLILELKLSDASPKSNPDLSELERDFRVLGKQQFSNTTIINGAISTGISWQYILMPKQEGTYTIPSITIDSSEGTFQSKPISVSVGKASSHPLNREDKRTTLSAHVNKTDPYKSETIIYTVRLISQESLTNIQLGEPSIKGAIVKALGKPKIYQEMKNGSARNVLEAKYSITPLKPGLLTIPSFIIQGARVVQDKSPFDSFFGHEGDPFGLLQRFESMGGFGFEKLDPFSLASDEIALDVKSPPADVSPWLPATSLKISESIKDLQSAKVGEPLTRTFTIVGEGIAANQLPNLKEQQGLGNNFKIYADKPLTEESFKKDTITSWREEVYTLIPQHSGTLVLPEISIAWWDVKASKIAYAKIPERTLEVAPGDHQAPPSSLMPPQLNEHGTSKQIEENIPPPLASKTSQTGTPSYTIFYAIIGALLITIVGVILWAIKLKRGLSKFERENERKDPILESKKAEKLPSKGIMRKPPEIKNAKELYLFLQTYGHSHWNTPINAPLDSLFSAALKHCPTLSQEDIDYVVKSLNDALYADKTINLEEVKTRCMAILTSTKGKPLKLRDKIKNLPNLNPT